ncbi:unnamed protein product [Protopolystoma xenopodis]|uniref:Uncharacterized protein n=1 Tax=Protopolystoma xenopodis TaxID=117903 RepID=A0A3S5B8D1_9PLAT|nr:unnamed protein product [Protopolystoma xenopodis]
MITDESFAPFRRNRTRLPRKQRQLECSSKANRQLVKRNPASSSGGTELRITSANTFTRNGSELNNNYETKESSKPNFSSYPTMLSTPEASLFLRPPGHSSWYVRETKQHSI